jgi:superfamily I DNA/RNA helicase
VVQAHAITDQAAYFRASRKGRGTSLSRPQRAAVWSVFEEYKQQLAALGKIEWPDLIQQARLYLATKGNVLPYRAIVVDETQDLKLEELRLLRQMVPEGVNDLFFVGDAHQRIYGRPIAMSQCGINIRGRSSKLRINYRTTEEIRNWAVSVLTNQRVDDLDGGVDTQEEYLSLMHGSKPAIHQFATLEEEIDYLIPEIWRYSEHSRPENVCLVARTHNQLQNDYIPALKQAGMNYHYLEADTKEDTRSGVRVATMHRVKGLEFTHVLIVGANEHILPLNRYAQDADEVERTEHEVQERCLLHVAASRARESLGISSYGKASIFLQM